MDGNSIGFDKHIVILTPGFPASESDNNCIPALQGYVKELALNIGAENISVFTFQYPFENKNYKWNGINVYSARGKNRGHIFRILTVIRILFAFRKIKKTQRNIVIHSFWLTLPALVGQWLGKLFSLKHIASIMGQDALDRNFYLRFINPKSTTVIGNSLLVSEIYFTNKNVKVSSTIILGIQPLDYDHSYEVFSKFDIVCCGSFIELKQYHLLPEIVAQLKQNYPKIKVGLIGDGSEKKRLINLINENKLNDNIHLLGSVDHQQILGYLKSAKLFLHLSNYEASSHAILEAHYVGLPVVSFKVGMYETENLTYQCKNINEMENVISYLLNTKVANVSNHVPLIKETVNEYMKYYAR